MFLNTSNFENGAMISTRMQLFKLYARERLIYDVISYIPSMVDPYGNSFIGVLGFFRAMYVINISLLIKNYFYTLRDKLNHIVDLIFLIVFVV